MLLRVLRLALSASTSSLSFSLLLTPGLPSVAGSYLRLIDFVYHSTQGLRVIKKKNKKKGLPVLRIASGLPSVMGGSFSLLLTSGRPSVLLLTSDLPSVLLLASDLPSKSLLTSGLPSVLLLASGLPSVMGVHTRVTISVGCAHQVDHQ